MSHINSKVLFVSEENLVKTKLNSDIHQERRNLEWEKAYLKAKNDCKQLENCESQNNSHKYKENNRNKSGENYETLGSNDVKKEEFAEINIANTKAQFKFALSPTAQEVLGGDKSNLQKDTERTNSKLYAENTLSVVVTNKEYLDYAEAEVQVKGAFFNKREEAAPNNYGQTLDTRRAVFQKRSKVVRGFNVFVQENGDIKLWFREQSYTNKQGIELAGKLRLMLSEAGVRLAKFTLNGVVIFNDGNEAKTDIVDEVVM